MSVLLSLWKKGQGRAGCGQITSTSLFAPASAPGELGVHRRNQKTWVPVPALPLTAYVTLGKLPDISKSQFYYRMLWGLSNMVYINVICSLPTSVEMTFITMGLASPCSSLVFWRVPSWSSPDDSNSFASPLPSLHRNHWSCPLHVSHSVKLHGLILMLDCGIFLSPLTLLSPLFSLRIACLWASKSKSNAWRFRKCWSKGLR